MERVRSQKKVPPVAVKVGESMLSQVVRQTHPSWKEPTKSFVSSNYTAPVALPMKPQGMLQVSYRGLLHSDGTAVRAYYVGSILIGVATFGATMVTFGYHHIEKGDQFGRYNTEAELHKAIRLLVQGVDV